VRAALPQVITLAGFPEDSHFVQGDPEVLAAVLDPHATPQDRARLFFPIESEEGARRAFATQPGPRSSLKPGLKRSACGGSTV
jgi:hypothetical protein